MGQLIDFSQSDSLLSVRHNRTFIKADQKSFNGIIKSKAEDEIKLAYYKNGNKFQEYIYLDNNRTSKLSIWWNTNGELKCIPTDRKVESGMSSLRIVSEWKPFI